MMTFIIQHLPIYLAETTRAWLESLPEGCIDNQADLWEVFIGNFQGTYVRRSNSWDLKSCKQKAGETLREYIQRFSVCRVLQLASSRNISLTKYTGRGTLQA